MNYYLRKCLLCFVDKTFFLNLIYSDFMNTEAGSRSAEVGQPTWEREVAGLIPCHDRVSQCL